MAVCLLTAGLLVNGHSQLADLDKGSGTDETAGEQRVLLGSASILVGSAGHALFYVVADKLLKPATSGVGSQPDLAPAELSGVLGQVELAVLLAYHSALLFAGVGGGAAALLGRPIAEAGGSVAAVATGYGALTLCNAVSSE
eukprot:SAG31_NODE_3004_length_4795_cov_2.802598_3_plen_142_part_00